MLHVSACLVVVAIINFIWDLGRSTITVRAVSPAPVASAR